MTTKITLARNVNDVTITSPQNSHILVYSGGLWRNVLSSLIGGGGTTVASGISTSTTNFNGILSASDTNVQKALETIDNHSHALSNNTPAATNAVASPGAGTLPAKDSHIHNIGYLDSTPNSVSDTAGSSGASAWPARRDHRHQIASHAATGVTLNTTSFNNELSSADDTVQKAMETLDNHTHSVEYHVHDPWNSLTETNTPYWVSATSFAIFSSPIISSLTKGSKIKLTQYGDLYPRYFYVLGVSGAEPYTVTITGGSTYTLSNLQITSMYLSNEDLVADFPAWLPWTPSLTGGSADLSGYDTARFTIKGTTCFIMFIADNRSLSGSAGTIRIGLPVAPAYTNTTWPTCSRYLASDGYNMIRGVISTGSYIELYKNFSTENYLATETGLYLRCQGFFEF